MTNRNNTPRLTPGFYPSAFLLLTALTASATFAQEPGLTSRLTELEGRVKQLEALINQRPAAADSSAPSPSPWIGRFIEQDPVAKRWIEFKANGTFILQAGKGKFTGTWEQSHSTRVIHASSGFTEPFRLDSQGFVDSRGVAWRKENK